MEKVRRREPVTVLALGASITLAHKGHGIAQAKQIHRLFVRAKGGTDSCFMAKKIKAFMHAIGARVDLAVLEFGVNDGFADWMVEGSPSHQRQTRICYEALVRLLLGTGAETAVVGLDFAQEQLRELPGEVLHEQVARHYGIPMLSWRTALKQMIRERFPAGCPSGLPICTTDEMTVTTDDVEHPVLRMCACSPGADSKYGQLGAVIFFDGTHPREWGHRVAGDLFVMLAARATELKDAAWPIPNLTVDSGVSVARAMSTVDVVYNKDYLSCNHRRCSWCDLAESHGAAWRCYEDVPSKVGWIADASDAPGGQDLKFRIELPDGKYTVSIGYLRSYSKMARFRVTTFDGEHRELASIELDGLWDRHVSLLQSSAVAEVTGSCTVVFTTLPQQAGRAGNKVKIQSLTAVRGHWLTAQ
eukprot:g5315.t1